MLSICSSVVQSAAIHKCVHVLWQVQVTSADISPHLSAQQESEQQLQVQVSVSFLYYDKLLVLFKLHKTDGAERVQNSVSRGKKEWCLSG